MLFLVLSDTLVYSFMTCFIFKSSLTLHFFHFFLFIVLSLSSSSLLPPHSLFAASAAHGKSCGTKRMISQRCGGGVSTVSRCMRLVFFGVSFKIIDLPVSSVCPFLNFLFKLLSEEGEIVKMSMPEDASRILDVTIWSLVSKVTGKQQC